MHYLLPLEHHPYNIWVSNLWQKPRLVISSLLRRVGEKVKHHYQSLFRNIPKMKLFLLTMEEYIAQTERWRSGEEHSQFLLTFLHPYKPLISSTISGWLKTVLMKSSIDTSIFKTHSTRSVSTSKTGLHGASIQGIF